MARWLIARLLGAVAVVLATVVAVQRPRRAPRARRGAAGRCVGRDARGRAAQAAARRLRRLARRARERAGRGSVRARRRGRARAPRRRARGQHRALPGFLWFTKRAIDSDPPNFTLPGVNTICGLAGWSAVLGATLSLVAAVVAVLLDPRVEARAR